MCIGARIQHPALSSPQLHLTVHSGRQIGINHVAKNGQRCRHFVHRHEPAVVASSVQVYCPKLVQSLV